MKYAIGVDIGGTKINIGAVNDQGAVIKDKRIPAEPKEPKALINNISQVVQDLEKAIGNSAIGIGVGMAGQIEADTGLVHFAPNLQWHDVPLQAELSKNTGRKVVITNDVRAITWGEWIHGAGKGCKDLVCIFFGTGIGSGIVSGGHLLTGANNTAGEIGHMVVDFNGPACTCGGWGCMEAYAGGWAIARQAEKGLLLDPNGDILTRLIEDNNGEVSAKIVIEAYRHDDPVATKVIQNALQAIVAGCVSIVNAFGPARLILGGGILEGLPEILELVNAGVRERALPAASEELQVVKAQLSQDASVVGAADFALSTFQKGSQ